MKYAECYECEKRLDIGNKAIAHEGNLFCRLNCLFAFVEYLSREITVDEDDCEHEDDAE